MLFGRLRALLRAFDNVAQPEPLFRLSKGRVDSPPVVVAQRYRATNRYSGFYYDKLLGWRRELGLY